MENNNERLLEAYFAGGLSQAEQTEMKALLANDPDFAAEFAWRQAVARAVHIGAEKDPTYLKLKELERRFRFRRMILQISAVAATLVLLIFAVKFVPPIFESKKPSLVTQDSTQQPVLPPQQPVIQTPTAEEIRQDSIQAAEKLRRQKEKERELRLLRDSLSKAVVANFEHFLNVSRYNNAGAGVAAKDSLAVKAYGFYNDSAYMQATQVFKRVVAADPANMENQFYYGVSLLGGKQYAAAANVFHIVAGKQSDYQAPAKFYLGMAHSGAGEFKAGRQAFEDYLAEPPSKKRQFKDLAEKMLKKLPPQ